jgi:hypothetical protein
MIKILSSFIDEKTSITIDDDGIAIDSKYDTITRLIESIYRRAIIKYGPSDGFFGKYLAMQLDKYGAEIIQVSDSEEEEAKENAVY